MCVCVCVCVCWGGACSIYIIPVFVRYVYFMFIDKINKTDRYMIPISNPLRSEGVQKFNLCCSTSRATLSV